MLDTQANVPATISVVFPRADSGVLGTSVYAVDVTLASLALTDYGDEVGRTGSHLIHVAAIANFTGGGSPANDAQLTTLATQIATDWYLWRLASVVAKYRGIAAWTCDGMHDIEYIHAESIMTSVTASRWEPDFSDVKICGTYGSADVPVSASGLTSLNGETGPAVSIAGDSWIGVSAGSNTISLTFNSGLLPSAPSINSYTGYSFTLSSSDSTISISTGSNPINFTARVADLTHTGILSLTTQNIVGDKTFKDDVYVDGIVTIGGAAVGSSLLTVSGDLTVFGGVAYFDSLSAGPDVVTEIISSANDSSRVTLTNGIEGSVVISAESPFYNNSSHAVTVAGYEVKFDSQAYVAAGSITVWATATAYNAGVYVSVVTDLYLCIYPHLSGADTEPGTGSDWEDYWVYFSDDITGNQLYQSMPSISVLRPAPTPAFAEGFTGKVLGMDFVSGWLIGISDPAIPLSVKKGGTGATSFTSGQILVGSGTSPFAPVTGTKVVSNKLQLKGDTTDDWWQILPSESF